MRTVANGPLIPAATVLSARQKYLETSDLSPAEKAAAIRSLQRYARGVFEKKIPVESVHAVIEPVAAPTERENRQVQKDADGNEIVLVRVGQPGLLFKNDATRAEIDQFLALAKQVADDARIPDEPFEPDWGLELKKAIGDALKGP
jgi:hypothetical protein